MKVFISWSGDLSRSVAVILREWLPLVIQAIQPYVSSEDIRKGSRWVVEVGKHLDVTTGILCITRDNIGAAWVNFEAGTLFKALDSSRVVPFLIGLRPADLDGPLAQFQATIFEKEDVWKLVTGLNQQGESPLSEPSLRRTFDMWWPELETKIGEVMKAAGSSSAAEKVDPQEVPARVTEILELVREQGRTLAALGEAVALIKPANGGFGVVPPGWLSAYPYLGAPGSMSPTPPPPPTRRRLSANGRLRVRPDGRLGIRDQDFGRRIPLGSVAEAEAALMREFGVKEGSARAVLTGIGPGDYFFRVVDGEMILIDKGVPPGPTSAEASH